MDKTDPNSRSRVMMQQQIQRIIADKGTRRVGHRAGQARILNGLRHLRHGDCGKNTIRTIGDDQFFHRLIARVVGDPRTADVDADALRCHGAAATGLSHAEDHIGADLRCFVQHDLRGHTHHRGDLHSVHFKFPDHFRQQFYRFPGRIDTLPAKGIKTGNQQFFHFGTSTFLKIIPYYTKLCKITHSVFEKLLYNEPIS